jgi:GAF domain-containing protein/two-component sensor histidine kinase
MAMGRHSRAGSAKARRRKPAAPKRASGAGATRPGRLSAAGHGSEIARLKRELAEARQQETAKTEVLRIISSSSASLDRVFKTMLEYATRICEAKFGTLFLCEGETFRVVAGVNTPAELAKYQVQRGRFQPIPGGWLDRIVKTKDLVHTLDAAAETAPVSEARFGGARSSLSVPMLTARKLIGAFSIYRQEVRPFTENQIALIQNFAAQAVIAIENARLLNELRDSLQQQTATADVLKVINRSTFDLTMVLDTLVNSAARLCRADKANIALVRDGIIDYVTQVGFPPDFLPYMRSLRLKVRRGSISGQAALVGKIIHLPDVLADPEFVLLDAQKVGGFRTALGVPLMRGGTPIGTMFLARAKVEPFTEQQIELVTTFADQAVIAMENARLLRELDREREALARQHQADARYMSWLRQLAGFLRHEVRQPVAQINSSVELIHLTSHDDQLKPYIASAAQGVRHVWNLIERASRATDAEAFVRQGQAQLIDLSRLLRELMESYQQTHSGTDFRVQRPDNEPIYVSADPTLLKEAVSNLLANAASFADEESIIQIVLERDEVHAIIKVRNKGPLIQSDTEMLFGPFASTRSGPSSEHQGLGLYLVRLVAEHHGGKAIISNLDDGSGVEASILLPL